MIHHPDQTAMTPSHSTLMIAALITGPIIAQPRVDIDLHRAGDGRVLVQLIPESDFEGVPSSLVFTVSWIATNNDPLPELQQTQEQSAWITLAPSGPVHEVGDKRYRIYSGIGLFPIADGGQPWHGAMSLTIGTFGPDSPADLLIADDEWVKERRNNGAFYVSLNGLERTGQLRCGTTAAGIEVPFSFSVKPNPSNGQPVTFLATLPGDGALTIDIADVEGKTIRTDRFLSVDGVAQGLIAPAGTLAPGTYVLTVRTGTLTRTERLVVTSRMR